MSLTQALSVAISGLKVNQSAMSLVAANVANADTPGYVRKSINQVATSANNAGISVRVSSINRELDQYVQRQLRVENAGASYATARADLYSRLQDVYGTPGSTSTLETVYNNFTASLQGLSTSPDDPAAQSSVISSAQTLAQQLNQMSSSIQGLRGDAELQISDAVTQANQAMSQIAAINTKIQASTQSDTALASLQDQRDQYIDQLSQLMDINVVQGDNNSVSVFTNSGVQLVGNKAAQLSFTANGSINAQSTWSADPTKNAVGTVSLTTPDGNNIDLLASNSLRSGTIAGLVQMRDQDLVQAQSQLDAIAAAMSSALSDKTTQGTPVTSGLQLGFDVDLSGLQSGNTVTVNYTDGLTNTPRTMTLVRVDDKSVLPLSDTATANPNDRVFGIDFSGGMSSVVDQINKALGGTGMSAQNTSGSTLRVLNDGAGNIVKVTGVATTATSTSLTGDTTLPLFLDGNAAYTGAISTLGSQSIGLAGRITVNGSLAGDPSKLVQYTSSTDSGDATRPNFILQQLTGGKTQFSASTGIGTTGSPFSGTITTFLRQVISKQGDAASSAANLKEGQDVVLSSLQQRFNDSASVNVDQEMSNLLTLQNSYAANARIMSAINDMFQTLLKM